jgi:hypothetical protein
MVEGVGRTLLAWSTLSKRGAITVPDEPVGGPEARRHIGV